MTLAPKPVGNVVDPSHLQIDESASQVERSCAGFPRNLKIVRGGYSTGYAAAPPSDRLVLSATQTVVEDGGGDLLRLHRSLRAKRLMFCHTTVVSWV